MLLAALAALALTTQQAEPPAPPSAMEQVSAALSSGETSGADFERARDRLIADAAGGDAEAMNITGVLVQRGLAASNRSAEDWYRAAMGQGEKGVAEAAAINLALLLYMTEGRAGEARGLLEALENPEAHLAPMQQGYLGYDYLSGMGGERNTDLGRAYLNGAIATGFVNSFIFEAYAEFWLNPPDSLEPRPDRADELYRRAIDAGSVNAAWRLAMLFLETGRSEADAYDLVSWASDRAHPQAMISRGVMLAVGQGVDADPAEARNWYLRAAKAGQAHGLRSLGGMWVTGEGGEADPALGYALLDMAAEAGDEGVVPLLSVLTEAGHERPSDRAVRRAREAFVAAEGIDMATLR